MEINLNNYFALAEHKETSDYENLLTFHDIRNTKPVDDHHTIPY